MNVHEGSIRARERAREGLHLYPDFSAGRTREAQTVSTIRIMLVEDDLDYRYLIEQALRREADLEPCTRLRRRKKRGASRAHGTTGYCLDGSALARSPG